MIYKKTVILSSLDNSLKKAVLNLDSKAGNLKGDVKLYNFVEEPMGVLSLGLLIDNKVHKAGLTRTGYMEYTFGSIITKIPSACTCAVVSSKGGNVEPILLGSVDSNSSSLETALLQNLTLTTETSAKKVEEALNQSLGEYEDQEEIEAEIDKCMGQCQNGCVNCDYKKVFYEEQADASIENEKIENKTEEDLLKNNIKRGQLRVPNLKENINFIDEIGGQIDLLFNQYPEETILAEIIPNSKWVKVDFNGEQKYYVVGLIYEKEQVKYVCYGIPSTYTENPPADFNEKAQWLPIDLNNTQGEGYWITYQDAIDGDLIQVEII